MSERQTRRRFITQTAAATLMGTPMSHVFASDRQNADHSSVRKVHLDSGSTFDEVKERLENDYPGTKISVVDVDGEHNLHADHGGMKLFWIYRGRGEVFLPEGYRTQEGGQEQLPGEYQPDTIDPAVVDVLGLIKGNLLTLTEAAAVHVQAILKRWQGNLFTGDFPAELWGLEHTSRPWSQSEQVEAALVSLFDIYRRLGYSTKQTGSYEPVMAGDQLVAYGKEPVPVRGRFRCLALEKTDRTVSHISTARRLRYLVDTAGGCSFDFDPYRRLPLTWYLDHPGEQGDGVNFANSHVVNIPEELSSTHFHPLQSQIGGFPQTEMYLVLDPKLHGLDPKGRKPSLIVFPDLTDLRLYEQHPLEPGDLVYIPPNVGHRGLDVFVNVLTVPGFKPHNEFYIDHDIYDRAGGKSPYNKAGFSRKNYDRLEQLL